MKSLPLPQIYGQKNETSFVGQRDYICHYQRSVPAEDVAGVDFFLHVV